LVGLFTARVFDTSPGQVRDNGVLLDDEEEIYERELQYTFKAKESIYSIDIAIIGPKESKPYKLHRFVQIIAIMYGMSIFAEGMLERLHLSLPDKKRYDDFVVYRPLDGHTAESILRDLRVGVAHSRQCDVDHRLGSTKARYLHGLLYAAPISHRMNMCFIYTRKTAGHWCFGLLISKYSGGKKTTSVSHKFLKRIKIVDDKPTFDKATIEGIDPFTFLPPLIKDWIIDVDCYCSSMKKGKSLCDICKKNAEEKAR
jgi:hypothetical protein